MVVDISCPRLKIVSSKLPPKAELNGKVYEFGELRTKLHDLFGQFREKTVCLLADESDIAFYNQEGITVEDFESLIRILDDEVDHFNIDLIGITKSAPKLR